MICYKNLEKIIIFIIITIKLIKELKLNRNEFQTAICSSINKIIPLYCHYINKIYLNYITDNSLKSDIYEKCKIYIKKNMKLNNITL